MSGRSMPMPKAFVAQTTRSDPSANRSWTRVRSDSSMPAWYASAATPASRSASAARAALLRVAA